MAPRRPQRVAAQVIREVGAIIEHRLSDPELGFVTVRTVQVSRDLRVARVFVGVLGDASQAERSMLALQRARGFIRRELAQRLRLRLVPEVRFQLDPTMITEESLQQLRDDAARSGQSDGDPASGVPDD